MPAYFCERSSEVRAQGALDGLRGRLLAATRWGVLRRPAPSSRLGLQKIGSDYGGWIVPTAAVSGDWICYSGGVGEDISFDMGLIERFGCNVYAFDPTPRAIRYVRDRAREEPR